MNDVLRSVFIVVSTAQRHHGVSATSLECPAHQTGQLLHGRKMKGGTFLVGCFASLDLAMRISPRFNS